MPMSTTAGRVAPSSLELARAHHPISGRANEADGKQKSLSVECLCVGVALAVAVGRDWTSDQTSPVSAGYPGVPGQ